MSQIKICGLTREEDIDAANKAKPDYIGFVFVPDSRRYISPERAAQLRRLLDPSIRVVGVFRHADPREVLALVREKTIDLAQLHGLPLSPVNYRLIPQDFISTRKPETFPIEYLQAAGVMVVRAVSVVSPESVRRATASRADLLLFEGIRSGEGKSFDWDLLAHLQRSYGLAGGLNIENLPEALERLNPLVVDISSGAETNGQKDPEKMLQLVQIVREHTARNP